MTTLKTIASAVFMTLVAAGATHAFAATSTDVQSPRAQVNARVDDAQSPRGQDAQAPATQDDAQSPRGPQA